MVKFSKATLEIIRIDANDIYTTDSCIVFDPNETPLDCVGRDPR